MTSARALTTTRASEQARRSLAQIGEEVLADLSDQLDAVSRELFLFPACQQKIHICAPANTHMLTQSTYGAKLYVDMVNIGSASPGIFRNRRIP
jgi:hypothetical protein